MLRTGDTCAGRHTGSPSLPHFQSETPPAAKSKHQEPLLFSHRTRTHTHTHIHRPLCGPQPWVFLTNLMAAQLQKNRFEEAFWPVADVTHVCSLFKSICSVMSSGFPLFFQITRKTLLRLWPDSSDSNPPLSINPSEECRLHRRGGTALGEGVSSYISWHRQRWTFTHKHTAQPQMRGRHSWCI